MTAPDAATTFSAEQATCFECFLVRLTQIVQPSPARPVGFEPTTLGSEDRCAIQLRHGRGLSYNVGGNLGGSQGGQLRFRRPAFPARWAAMSPFERRPIPKPIMIQVSRGTHPRACTEQRVIGMMQVTIRILDGSGRGRVFEDLVTPVTIGREEGNTIQVNDDRVSRYHLKIQEDNDKLVLTDLESTNGTKVNGEDIQLRILRHGDLITVGRSVLLVGSRDEIADRLAELRVSQGLDTCKDDPESAPLDPDQQDAIEQIDRLAVELDWDENPTDIHATLHALRPPSVPDHLSPGQAAELSEMIDYIRLRIRRLLLHAKPHNDSEMLVGQRQWQDILDLQGQLAEYLRRIGEPPNA